jgi:hypothetical protein
VIGAREMHEAVQAIDGMVAVLGSSRFNRASAAAPQSSAATQGQSAQDADLTPTELDNLVAPIALYPDALVAVRDPGA